MGKALRMAGGFAGGFITCAAAWAATPAAAQDCRSAWSSGPPPGTLASPTSPCAGAPSNGRPRGRTEKTRPGTYQSGNTTIHVGGSVSTEVGIGGMHGR